MIITIKTNTTDVTKTPDILQQIALDLESKEQNISSLDEYPLYEEDGQFVGNYYNISIENN